MQNIPLIVYWFNDTVCVCKHTEDGAQIYIGKC